MHSSPTSIGSAERRGGDGAPLDVARVVLDEPEVVRRVEEAHRRRDLHRRRELDAHVARHHRDRVAVDEDEAEPRVNDDARRRT